ncbi:MAG: hypothetical protein R3C68_18130, partial [Myxococcota bacterium]
MAQWHAFLRHEILTPPQSMPNPVDALAGSALLLKPGTHYEFRLTLSDPDGGSTQRVVQATTRVQPRAYVGGRTFYVMPGSGGGTGTASDPLRGLASADAKAQAGDLFLLQAGSYLGGTALTKDGSAGKPITYRGLTPESVILDGNGASYVLNFDDRQYITVEGMTLRSQGTAIKASNTTNITLRHLDVSILGSESAAMTMWGYNRDNIICDNQVIGASSNFPDRNVSAYGWFVSGEGHVICNNRIAHFRDAISLSPLDRADKSSRSIDIYNNDIYEVHDDAIEADYTYHNIRIFRNRMAHFVSGVSAQPSLAGPMYIFRNEFFNTLTAPTAGNPYTGSPFKFSEASGYCTTGILVFHNTSINVGFSFSASTVFPNSTFRNNLLYGKNGKAFELYTPGACLGDSATPANFDFDGMNSTWGTWATIDGVNYSSLLDFQNRTGNEL